MSKRQQLIELDEDAAALKKLKLKMPVLILQCVMLSYRIKFRCIKKKFPRDQFVGKWRSRCTISEEIAKVINQWLK